MVLCSARDGTVGRAIRFAKGDACGSDPTGRTIDICHSHKVELEILNMTLWYVMIESWYCIKNIWERNMSHGFAHVRTLPGFINLSAHHSQFILIMALCRTFIAVGSATCVGARFTQFRFPKAVFLLCSFQNLHILVHFVGFGCILLGSNNLLLGRFKLWRCLLLHSSLRPWPSCPMAEVEQSAPYGVYTAQPTVLETWSWFQLKISTVGSILHYA